MKPIAPGVSMSHPETTYDESTNVGQVTLTPEMPPPPVAATPDVIAMASGNRNITTPARIVTHTAPIVPMATPFKQRPMTCDMRLSLVVVSFVQAQPSWFALRSVVVSVV
jgi:hypothetical protein